jgi:hypothetical protein
MSWDQTGADYVTMATGLSARGAAYVWIRGHWREQWQRRTALKSRNWHGYINLLLLNAGWRGAGLSVR